MSASLLNVVAFLAANYLLAICSRRLAARFANGSLEQLSVALLLFFAWLITASLIAATFGFYHLPGMSCLLVPWLAIAWIWGRRPSGTAMALVRYGLRWLRPRKWLRVVLLPHLWFLVENARAVAAPPRAWDALVYHLPRAAFWVQDHGYSSRVWPEDQKFYDFFGPAGDLLWAWTMQAGVGDALLFLAYLFIWVWMTANTWLLARQVGLDSERAALAVGVTMSTPALLAAANSALVDNLTAALLVLGLGALLRSRQPEGGPWLLVAISSVALAACTKFTAVPLLAVTLIVVAYLAWQARLVRRCWFSFLVAVAIAPFLMIVTRTWMITSSLTYPFQLLDGVVPWLRGSPLLAALLATGLENRSSSTWGLLLLKLMLQPLNLGLWLGLLLPMAMIGIWRLKQRMPTIYFATLLIFAAVPVAGAVVPANHAMIDLWAWLLGRHWLVPMLVVVLAAASLQHRMVAMLLGLAIVQNCLVRMFASGLIWAEVEMMVAIAGPLVVCIAVLFWPGSTIPTMGRPIPALMAMSGLLAVYSLYTLPARDRERHNFYALVGDPASYEMHLTNYSEFIESWRMLDGESGELIGFSSDQHGFWLLYPYFGTRLQNCVEPMSVTVVSTDGEFVREGNADSRARFARLARKSDIDVMVLRGHLPIESSVIESLGYRNVRPAQAGQISVYRRY